MIKKEYVSEKIGEKYTVVTYESGLKVFLCPKPSYAMSYALFGTKYGSIDTRFKRSDESSFTDVPEGIAHFLEHKLFESEDGDAFSRYAKTGASANAYTSFDVTCYLFSCSGRFADSFEILLDFVSSPYFTEQTVQKEQGIIGQEISMNDDNAPWKVFFNLLGVLYKEHPVRIDIAGTADSIAKITPELLYGCYNTFYNPGNMFICVAGNFSADEVLAAIDAGIKKVEPVEIERGRFDEPPEVVRDYIEQKMEVSLPLFALGFKEVCDKPQKSTEEKILTELLLEILAGDASPLYYELFSSRLINEEFAAEYFTGEGHAAVIFQGESERPEEVRDKVLDALKSLRENGVSKEEFERARKKLYGRYIMRYNAVENIAHMLTQCAQTGSGLFDDIAVLENAAPEKLIKRLESQLDISKTALSVVRPVSR